MLLPPRAHVPSKRVLSCAIFFGQGALQSIRLNSGPSHTHPHPVTVSVLRVQVAFIHLIILRRVCQAVRSLSPLGFGPAPSTAPGTEKALPKYLHSFKKCSAYAVLKLFKACENVSICKELTETRNNTEPQLDNLW